MRQRLVLITDEKFTAAIDDVIECLVSWGGVIVVHQLCDGIEVHGDDPAPAECLLVFLNFDTVQFDCAHQALERHRNQALLPRTAEQQDIGVDRIAQECFGNRIGVQGCQSFRADYIADCRDAIRSFEVGVAMRYEIASGNFGCIHDRTGMSGKVGRGRLWRRAHDQVATDQRIRPRRLDTHLVNVRGRVGNADITEYGPELLREAHEVQDARALALEMRSHCYELSYGDDAGTADARDEQVKAGVDCDGFGVRQRRKRVLKFVLNVETVAFRALAAFDRYEARAEAVDARVVLVARVLIDLALAAKRRFFRDYGQAIRFDRTIATSFTNQIVNHYDLFRGGDLAALALAA